VLDDRRREAMAAVGELIHVGSLPCRATRSNPVSVTLPRDRLITFRTEAPPGLTSEDYVVIIRACARRRCGLTIAVAYNKYAVYCARISHADVKPSIPLGAEAKGNTTRSGDSRILPWACIESSC
jgi:hypothetical protein